MKYRNQIAMVAHTVTELLTTIIVGKSMSQSGTDIQNVTTMTYEFDECNIPIVCEVFIDPPDRALTYQKYRDKLHPVNFKNKTKWNRIRSNPNLKHGRKEK